MLSKTIPAASLLWTHQPDPFDPNAAIYSFVHGCIAARVKVTAGSDLAVATLQVGRWAIFEKEQLSVREAFAQINNQISELAKQLAFTTKVPLPSVGTPDIKVYLDRSDDLTRWTLTFVSPTIDTNPQPHSLLWSYCVLQRYTLRRKSGGRMSRVD